MTKRILMIVATAALCMSAEAKVALKTLNEEDGNE